MSGEPMPAPAREAIDRLHERVADAVAECVAALIDLGYEDLAGQLPELLAPGSLLRREGDAA